MPKVLVQKFGGTSVDTDEHRQMAARKVLAARDAGYDPVVVVSAIGRRGAPYATDTLVQELKQIDPTAPPNPRELDMMMACGELISTAVMASTLQSMGSESLAISGGQAGIITDGEYGNARILSINPHSIWKAIERGQIPVVCGFQGVTSVTEEAEHGSITTLGRGGSDTTAAALGAALDACGVEIYTDVNGVKTADPDMVANAKTLPICTYAEVAEMAHLGAKVVHPRAAEIAMHYGIPLWVKSTFTEDPGTLIASESEAPPEVKDFLRQYYIRYSGPGGLTEQDDMENWNYAHAASRGTIARRYPYSYEQGMGFEVQNFAWDGLQLPGVVMDITEAKSSEHNLRNLYTRWAAFMEAESWDELATWRRPEPAKRTNGQSNRI